MNKTMSNLHGASILEGATDKRHIKKEKIKQDRGFYFIKVVREDFCEGVVFKQRTK